MSIDKKVKDNISSEKLIEEINLMKERMTSQIEMFEMTTTYLADLQIELQNSEKKLIETNNRLTESIKYAKHIQDAFVVRDSILKENFKDAFLFNKAKDIVSGDFVWMHESDEIIYFALGDCTGHGVPGAMLSIFVISTLNQILNQSAQLDPASIITKLDFLMKEYLGKYTNEINDGVEISIIQYDKSKNQLIFSGANRSIVHVQNQDFHLLKGEKSYPGNSQRTNKQTSNQYLHIQNNDLLYLYSDGFADQFGGENNKKYSSKKFLNLLNELKNFELEKQYQMLENELYSWKGANLQVDDITVVALKF